MKINVCASLLIVAIGIAGLVFAQPNGDVHGDPRTVPPARPPEEPINRSSASPVENIAPAFTEEWTEGNVRYRTYRSPEDWSGEDQNFSDWYFLTSGPAPDGYKISTVRFRLVGDRKCDAWAECAQVSRDDKTVTWKFKLQGHNEHKTLIFDYIGINNHNNQDGIHFRWVGSRATSIGVLNVGFVPIGH